MTTPLNERRIANAIRVLAMDAVQISLMWFGVNS